MLETVFAKAPLRMALAGGGTDLWSYFRHHGGWCLNGTIDQYAYCKVEPSDKYIFKSLDLGVEEVFDEMTSEAVYGDKEWSDGPLKLLINPYRFLTHQADSNIKRTPLKITTYVEAPPGSGLGSSSALVVAVLAAVAEYHNIPLGEYDIAEHAVFVERMICNCPGGRQDQFAAAFGGFNFIEFNSDGRTIVNPLRLNDKTRNLMELNTVLYYVGKPRKNARVIENTSKSLDKGNKEVEEATHDIKNACIEYKSVLLRGDLDQIPALMNRYWEMKLKTNKQVASSEILDTYNFAMKNGASAVKISGAGGGGHMVLYTDYEKRPQLIEALKERNNGGWFKKDLGGRIVPFKFVDHGVDVWRQ